MRRRKKYRVGAQAVFSGVNQSVTFDLGETWANNEHDAINQLKYKIVYNPDTMIFVCYQCEEAK